MLASLKVPAVKPRDLRPQHERYLTDWLGLLRANVAQGQQALRRLIDGRLTFTPRDGHYESRGVGTVEPMLGGPIHTVVSPTIPSWNQIQTWLLELSVFREGVYADEAIGA